MKQPVKKLTSILLTVVMTLSICFSLSGCKGKKADDSSVPTVPETTTTVGTTAFQSEFDKNPLTGEYNLEKNASTRPAAFMISNINLNGQQPGIDKADFYADMETEGGISRIMAVFSNIDRVPDKIGPIRSARAPYIKVADSLGSLYVHFGGKAYIRDRIKDTAASDIDGIFNASNAFVRDSSMVAPNNVTTSKDKIKSVAENKKYDLKKGNDNVFDFVLPNEKVSLSGAGKNIQVNISGSSVISFRYDSSEEKYTKHLGGLESGGIHISPDGKSIKVETIIVLYTRKFTEDGENTNFELDSGEGLLMNGGKSTIMNWTRNSAGFKITDTGGKDIKLPVGKIYMCVTDPANKEKTILS